MEHFTLSNEKVSWMPDKVLSSAATKHGFQQATVDSAG